MPIYYSFHQYRVIPFNIRCMPILYNFLDLLNMWHVPRTIHSMWYENLYFPIVSRVDIKAYSFSEIVCSRKFIQESWEYIRLTPHARLL